MSALDDVLHNLEVYNLLPVSVEDARAELEALQNALETRIPELEKRLEKYEALVAENAKLRELLKESEWAASNQEDCYCWCCHGQGWTETHEPDCKLAKALKENNDK